MNFDSILGQKNIVASLKMHIKNEKVGHAYLFVGPSGIGKKTLASIFSSILLCQYPSEEGSCEKCLPCKLTANKTNPDILLLRPSGTNIGIEDIRGIQKDIFIRPVYSTRKIYIIIDANKMTIQAQNCLLKMLEEPPRFTCFILTASKYDSILETIQSRTVKYSFCRNSSDEVKYFFKNRKNSPINELDFIAQYANGIIGTAIELIDSDDFINIRKKTIDLLHEMLSHQSNSLKIEHKLYDHFESNKDIFDRLLDILVLFYRDLLIYKKCKDQFILINSDKKDIIKNVVKDFNISLMLRSIEIIEFTRNSIKRNVNFQLAIEILITKLQEEKSRWQE